MYEGFFFTDFAFAHILGGKPDDITVVLARVTECQLEDEGT